MNFAGICLVRVETRLTVWRVQDALRRHVLGVVPGQPDSGPITPHEHLLHCFEYLYDAVICNADTTLEWVDENGIADGIGVRHQCKDFERLRQWAGEHKSL